MATGQDRTVQGKLTASHRQSLYIGFSFDAKNTMQGLQNQLYAIFMFLVLFGNLNEQIMPMFVPQRDLYEARERPSKIYKWNGELTLTPGRVGCV